MKIDEIALLAIKQINVKSNVLQLVLPKRSRQYKSYYLVGKKSPKGKCVGFNGEGEIVNFNAVDVLAWCARIGVKFDIVLPSGEKISIDDFIRDTESNENKK